MSTHEEYKEMLAAHALGALDGAEARSLEAHLEGCPECRAEADAWLETAAALAHAAPHGAPSPQLRSRILETIRAEEASPLPRSSLKREDLKAMGVAGEAPRTESNVVQFTKPARRAWRRMIPILPCPAGTH